MPKMNKNTAEHYSWGDVCDGWHLVQRDDLSVIHERMPPKAAEVLHYHTQARQFFFVLSGKATLEVGGEHQILESFEGFEVPPGVQHRIVNDSNQDVEFLVVSHPKGHGDRVLLDALNKNS